MPQPPETRLFATAPDGTRLPVIDITNPAFSSPISDEEIAALSAAALKDEQSRGPLQRLFLRFVLKRLARRSRLIAALQAANTGFMGGIPTYVLKLGPANLVPPYDTAIDRQVLKSPIVTGLRLRLAQMATLVADALAPRLAAEPGAPLVILEIAGGPSSDSLNALILLERRRLLAARSTRIVIYDIDSDGPAFAGSMLAALQTGSLRGRDIAIEHVSGNWSDRAALARVVSAFPDDAIIAAASEGGLFEYGSDADIGACLEVLSTRIDIVCGSVTRADLLNQLMRQHSGAKVIMRGLERFAELVAPAGYRIVATRPCPLSDQVVLTRL